MTSSNTLSVFNQTFINLTDLNNFTVETWVKLWNLNGKPIKISSENEIIKIPGVFGIRLNKDSIEVQVGTNSQWINALSGVERQN